MSNKTDEIPAIGFSAYVDAIVAYRMIMQRTLFLLVAEYGAFPIKQHFKTASLANLVDAHDSRFLTHRLAAKFVASQNSPKGRKIIEEMHKHLKFDPSLNAFADLSRQTGNGSIAADLPFYLEHRLRLARTVLMGDTKIGALEQIQVAANA